MNRVKSLVSRLSFLTLVCLTVSVTVPAAADALNPFSASGGTQPPQVSERNDDRVVAESGVAVGLPDFSESLTRGIGFKLSNAGEFVDFRIDGLAGGAPVSLGAQTIFFHDAGAVKYTTSGAAVKEDIVFNKRPLSDTISFTVSSSDLLPERTEEGGYRLYSLGGLPVFEISPPKVYDANGRAGKAVLDMQKGKASLTVDPDFLAKAAYPITVDPTVVVLSGGESSFVSQRNSFFDGNRYWVLYSDGTDYRAKSSTDTVNWTPASGYIAGVPAGVYLGAYYDGGATVYAAYRKNYYSIYARRGVISGNNIAWDATDYEVLAGNSASNAYAFPSISRDTNNRLWVSARYYDGSTWKARTRRATSANSAVSWSTSYTVSSNSYSAWLVPQAVPLPGGAMYFMYNLAYDLRGRYYTGSAFNAEQLITYTDAADSNHIPSGVADASNTVYMGYTDTSGSVKYRTLESPYTTWSGALALADDTGSGVALTLDAGANDIYAYYGHGIGGTGDQVRAVKLGEPKRKTIASDIVPPFGRVDAQTSTWVNTSVTTAAANETPGDVVNTLGSLMDATIAKFYVFSENKPDYINTRLSQTAAGITSLSAFYWDGSIWKSPPSFVDNTAKLTLADQDMTFTAPADWKKEAYSGMYRMYVRTNNTPTTKPIGTQILPYPNIQYISAPYSTGGDPFAIWTQGRNNNKVVFSANRAFERLGSASAGLSHAHNLKGAGAAVSLSSGNLALSVGGPAVPSRGVGVAPTFTYNSQSRNEGPLGMGWSSNLFARLYVGWTDGSVLYADGSGARYLFDYDNGSYSGPPELHMTLNTSGSDFVLKTRNQLTYTFDAVGKLRTVQDRNANTTLYNYDGEEKLANVVSASNTTTTLSYDENGNFLTGVTDPAGRTMTFSRDTTGDLTVIVDSMNNTTTLSYDANHNLTGFKDARGYTTGFAYANDKVVKITDPSPLSYQTNFTYNRTGTVVDGPRTDVIDVTTYNINPDGLVSEAIDPPGYALSDGSRWQYRQKISLNTGALGLTAGVAATHNLHISGNAVFSEVGTNKFWQKTSSVKGYVAFSNADSSTPLSYAIKDWDYGQRDAYLDIQDTFNADADTDIYLYYGYMSGGAYPKGPSDFAGAYDSNTKAAYSMTDDPDSSTAQDLSANNNDLTKFAPDQPGQSVGKTGKAQSFDGTNDRARAVDSNSLDIAGSVSLSAWVKLDSTIASQPLSYPSIFEKGAGTGPTRNYGLYLSRSNGYAVFSAYKSDGSGYAFYTSFPASALDDLGWHHLASVWDGSVARLYLDGSEESSSSGVGPLLTNTTYLAFGSNGIGTNGFLKGSIDDAGVSNTARSANWVKLTYRSVDGQDDIGAHGAGHYIEVTAPEGMTSYRYDADRNQVALTLPNGAVTTSAYDVGGNLLTETDPMGAVTRYAYNAKNDVVSTTDALGRNTAYSYDTTGNLTKKINADNTSETYVVNVYGQRTKSTNARGYDTNYTYTALGLPAKEIRVDDSSTTHEYDLAGSETTATDALGNKTVNTYDSLGRLTQATYPGGGKTFYEYDSVGNQTKESRLADLAIADMEADESWTGGAADTSNSVQGVQGRKVTSISGAPASASRSLSLDLGGEDTATGYIDEWVFVPDVSDLQVTSPIQISFDSTNGSYSHTVFHASLLDGWNQLHIAKTDFTVSGSPSWANITNMSNTVASASGRTANITFDDLRLVANKRLVKSLGYDILGRLTAESDALESTTTHQYDAAGNMTLEIDPIGGRFAYTYDALNRQVTELTASEDSSATETASYDLVGNVTSESQDSSDAEDASATTTYQYDADGRLVASIDSENETMAYEYNALSQVTTETDSEGNITARSYDLVGRVTTVTITTTETEPSISSTAYRYDAVGNVTVVIPPDGIIVESTYDELNRVRTQTDSTATVTHEYDLAGRETTTTSSEAGTMTMTYNDVGQEIAETDSSGSVTSYEYDTQGNLIQLTDASGSVNYQYNEAGEQIKAVDSEGNIEAKTLDGNDNLTQVGIEGASTSYTYNAQSFAVASVATNETTTTYMYSGQRNRIKMVQPNGVRTRYTYDSKNGLTSLETSTSTGTRLLKYSYRIGNKGNITTETLSGVGTSNYRYDGKRQLIYWKNASGVETTYAYNACGNRTRLSSSDGITSYVYDSYQQLKSSTDNSGTTTYTYNDQGLLTKKITPAGTYTYTYNSKSRLTAISGPGVSASMSYGGVGQLVTLTVNGTTKRFVYANGKLVAEKNVSGMTIATYVYDRLGLPLSIKKNSATYFFHLNHRGDVRKITDNNQNVVAEYTYDPWGKVLTETGSFAGEQPLRYEAMYYEPTLSVYLPFIYDPILGRTLVSPAPWSRSNPIAPAFIEMNTRKKWSQQKNRNVGVGFKGNFPANVYGQPHYKRSVTTTKPRTRVANQARSLWVDPGYEGDREIDARFGIEDEPHLNLAHIEGWAQFGMYKDGKIRDALYGNFPYAWAGPDPYEHNTHDPFGHWFIDGYSPGNINHMSQVTGGSHGGLYYPAVFTYTGDFHFQAYTDWWNPNPLVVRSHLLHGGKLNPDWLYRHNLTLKLYVNNDFCKPVLAEGTARGQIASYLPLWIDGWYRDVDTN